MHHRKSRLLKHARARSAAETTLMQSLRTASPLLEVMNSLVPTLLLGLLSPDGRVLYINQAALNKGGLALEQVLGLPFDETPWWDTPAEDRARLRAEMARAAGGQAARFEVRYRETTGCLRMVDFNLQPVFGDAGQVAYIVASSADVTERQAAEDARHLTQFAIDRASTAVLRVQPDGKVHYANESACQLLGYTQDRLVGMPVSAFDTQVTAESFPRRWAELRERGGVQFETVYRRSDGHGIPVHLTVNHIEYRGGEYSFCFVVDISASKQAERAIHSLAYHDQLTGLPNRVSFLGEVSRQINDGGAGQADCAVLIVDVARFRPIMATLGQPVGDRLVEQIAGRLASLVDGRTWLARIGPDQFGLLACGAGSREAAGPVIKQVQDSFAAPFRVRETELRLSCRIGISLYPQDGADAESVFKHAEAALNQAKASGQHCFFYSRHISDGAAQRLALENKLQQALEKEEFVLHYQPKVGLGTGRIEGVEALIRWNSPELGLVAPAEFIPLIEETGLILKVGAWALCKAAQDHRAWVEQGLAAPRVAVNVSTVQLRTPDFADIVRRALAQGAPAPGLDIEVTESFVMNDVERIIETLAAIRDMGVDIAVDDFGTGYSSLAYLVRLPVQILKIDRSFVSTMLENGATMTLVRAVVSLAHALRLDVVAEGVETAEQMQALREIGCDQIQGYYVGKPVPAQALAGMLAQRAG